MSDAPSDSIPLEIIAGLRQIGYLGALLEENYSFPDHFRGKQERTLVAAAFGEVPISYESACIGVVRANGLRGQPLIDEFRAFGAPILLEIDHDEIREWEVSPRENGHGLIERYPVAQIRHVLAKRAQDWKPEVMLRAKNIGSFQWSRQLSLFSGLLPELETQIQEDLDPLLRDALAATKTAYVESTGRNPDEESLFKLVFWILTAKVFHDRRINGFASLTGDADVLLRAVARQYRKKVPRLLNREARQAATDRIWMEMDFRHLSVEALAHNWSRTLVDEETRLRLGIHRTSRTIVKYMVDRIPFSPPGDDAKIVFEPCSGSAAFLIGAMKALRQNLFGAPPRERHRYFAKRLAGIEDDPFGVEISTLSLTLADFPNPGGWDIAKRDVFVPGALTAYLRRSAVVLCNPPFEDFPKDQRPAYLSYSKKPAELLNRVLIDLHPSGVLGFVLPLLAVDGRGYAPIRRKLAERFASVEWTVLPDKAFQADAEVALLIAKDPIPHDVCRVAYRRVNDDVISWGRFVREHAVSLDETADFTIEKAQASFAIPALPQVWKFLSNHPRLGTFAEIHRGIEWNKPLTTKGAETGHRLDLVRSNSPPEGFMLGVAPKSKFSVFEVPRMSHLSMREKDQRGHAWKHQWDKPKAILNKSARHRGAWRMAAFPDHEGVTCYQTFSGVWPLSNQYDETLLAAILNSPVANAFVATREGKTDITIETLLLVPMPVFTEPQRERLHSLVGRYQALVGDSLLPLSIPPPDAQERLLKEIDATVLDGYRLPPRLERELLDFFRGHERPISHEFSEYFPNDFEAYFSLSDYLSPGFAAANIGEFLKRMEGR